MSSILDAEKAQYNCKVPTCPHCGWKYQEFWDGPNWGQEVINEVECDECERKFFSQMAPPKFDSWSGE